jgi:AraC-like DNA-binding protein
MLRYFAAGERQLGDYPMPPHVRVNWEFLAVVRGKLSPCFKETDKVRPVADTLWVFPPGCVHGWIGEPRRACEVVVIHFSTVPEALERFVGERGHLVAPLAKPDKRLLVRLSRSLKQHYWQPSLVGDVYCQRALMDLSLILIRGIKESRQTNQAGVHLTRILDWEKWLRLHLGELPSIAKGARAVGISSSQLRRIFQRIKKRNPKQVFDKIRFDKAMHLMAESDAKLEKIAAESGFSSATNFCRAFKAHVGKSPTSWRREIYIQYKKPRAAEKATHEHHGRRYREL